MLMKNFLLILLYFINNVLVLSAQGTPGKWGDQGNGTYINPILNADYSDPDVIRVRDKYYMIASDFHFLGMQVLESSDMINWKLISQIYHHFDFPGWDNNQQYAGGSWAPSIRYHDNKFWVFFCTPKEGLFMSNAVNPSGPWSPLHLVKKVEKWEDPCPFWDEDGQAYLGRSRHGAGPIIIHKMSADGTRLLDEGMTVYTGPVAEGTKIFKKDGYYYLSIPEGGVGTGWQTILRSKNIYGPYEKKVVLEQGSTTINGPHQGAIVDTPDDQWAFFHFQHHHALGRVVHLQPMHWENDWPVIGVDFDRNGIGEPVYVCQKPIESKTIFAPQTDDDFSTPNLSLQWQFNHNPTDHAWSLSAHPGSLTLKALKSSTFRLARNTLTQKIMGNISEATIAMDFTEIADGQRCGLACMGKINNVLGIKMEKGQKYLYTSNDTTEISTTFPNGNQIYLRVSIDMTNQKFQYFYSTDNIRFIPYGTSFFIPFGFWKGARIALYCYNKEQEAGTASFQWFKYKHDGPQKKKNHLPKLHSYPKHPSLPSPFISPYSYTFNTNNTCSFPSRFHCRSSFILFHLFHPIHHLDPLPLSTTPTVLNRILISIPIFQFLTYSISSFTTSSKSVISLLPLTCHIPKHVYGCRGTQERTDETERDEGAHVQDGE